MDGVVAMRVDILFCTEDLATRIPAGLWPELNDGNYPCDCTAEAFNANEVAPITSQLDTYWPSLNGAGVGAWRPLPRRFHTLVSLPAGPNPSFWSHEWSKHGTCATVFNSQLDFFNSTLALRTRYDTVSALARAGIRPSNTVGFTIQALKSALQAAYGVSSIVTCDSQGRVQEVGVCVDKSLQPAAACTGVSDTCSATTVFLPASM